MTTSSLRAERQNRLNWEKFNAEGIEIACAFKRELPDWAVVWWDECKLSTLVRSGGEPPARHLIEFETMADCSLGPSPNAA